MLYLQSLSQRLSDPSIVDTWRCRNFRWKSRVFDGVWYQFPLHLSQTASLSSYWAGQVQWARSAPTAGYGQVTLL